jgi:hypothetical protein
VGHTITSCSSIAGSGIAYPQRPHFWKEKKGGGINAQEIKKPSDRVIPGKKECEVAPGRHCRTASSLLRALECNAKASYICGDRELLMVSKQNSEVITTLTLEDPAID